MHMVGESVADACLIECIGIEQTGEVYEIVDLNGWKFQLLKVPGCIGPPPVLVFAGFLCIYMVRQPVSDARFVEG